MTPVLQYRAKKEDNPEVLEQLSQTVSLTGNKKESTESSKPRSMVKKSVTYMKRNPWVPLVIGGVALGSTVIGSKLAWWGVKTAARTSGKMAKAALVGMLVSGATNMVKNRVTGASSTDEQALLELDENNS